MSNILNVNKRLNDKGKKTPRVLNTLSSLKEWSLTFCNSGTSYEMPRFYH